MALFTWSYKFSVKDDRMDEHHQRLVNLMNALDEAITAKKEDMIIGPAIDELCSYVSEHLTAEEKLMEALQFPELQSHRGMHQFFAKEIALLRAAYAAGETVRVKGIVQLLRDWLVYHIFNEDQKYARYLELSRVRAA